MTKSITKITFFFFLTLFYAQAQEGEKPCFNDLLAFDKYVRKLPSYKHQIKGNKKTEYEALFEHLKQKTAQSLSDFDCFCQISQLLNPLKDNHLGFYQTTQFIDTKKFSNQEYIKELKESAAYKRFPKATFNINQLEVDLRKKSIEEVEGIYKSSMWGDVITLGIFRTSKQDSLVAVVLESKLPNWDRGDIMMIMREKSKNNYRTLLAYIDSKMFLLLMNDKFLNGTLTESRFVKVNKPTSFEYLSAQTPVFSFKIISKTVQYIRLGSFNAMNDFLPVAQRFYDSIKDSLTAPNLIVDLRNNGGGAFKNSKKFLDLIQKYAKKGKVYTIVNSRTMSNAEEFTLKLRQLKNHTLLGTRTVGTLTYGSNYGQRYDLPSKRYEFAVTDMKGTDKQLAFEDVGIEPDVYLKTEQDFIVQVLEIIRNEKLIK
jgi:hypothetical protein